MKNYLKSSIASRSGQLKLAVLLYAAFTLAALLWGWAAGRPAHALIYVQGVHSMSSLLWGAGAGAGLGLLVVAFSQITVRRFHWARELYRWFAQILGPLSTGQAFLLALCSSVGEELLFRGAMQPTLGIWLTTLLFGLAHLPPEKRFLHWTLSATLLGLGFGAITLYSGNLAGALLGHFLVNFLNLGQLKKFAAEPVEVTGRFPKREDTTIATDDANRCDTAPPDPPPGAPGQGTGGPA